MMQNTCAYENDDEKKPDDGDQAIWIADARLSDGKRYIVRADKKLTAFLELESATRFQSLEARLSVGAETRLKLRTHVCFACKVRYYKGF